MTSAWIPIENYIQLKMSSQIKMQGNMLELYFLRNMEKIRLSPEAGRFLQLTHSIGNFIPVPRGFYDGDLILDGVENMLNGIYGI